MPKISVIAPFYGVEQYIHQFMDSVIAQTFTDFELIAVDDGSPDNCPQILDDYAKKDSRIRVIHQKNAGVAVARNTGIDASTGEYAYIVDSDDWLEINTLELLYRDAIKTGADVVMGDCTIHTPRGHYRLYQFSKKFYTEDPNVLAEIQQYVLCQKFSPYYSKSCTSGYAAPWGKLIRMSLIKENNIRFDPYVKGLFDDGLFTLAVYDHMKSFYYGMEYIYNYRINENSITQKFKKNEIDIMRLGFERIEDYIHENHREERLLLPYYCHVVRFLRQRLISYFFNSNNGKTYWEIRKELLSTIESEPFKTAIRKSKYKYFVRNHKMVLLCMRLHSVIGMREYVKKRKKAETRRVKQKTNNKKQ